jgi:hypothetical protein
MSEEIQSTRPAALLELETQMLKMADILSTLLPLYDDNMFRYLSKQSRNELLNDLMEVSGAVEDATKASVRVFKKIKRERVPDVVVDFLLADDYNSARDFVPESDSSDLSYIVDDIGTTTLQVGQKLTPEEYGASLAEFGDEFSVVKCNAAGDPIDSK